MTITINEILTNGIVFDLKDWDKKVINNYIVLLILNYFIKL